MSDISASIEGLDELIHKCSPELLIKPLTIFFTKSGMVVSSKAKELAPVDTGRLRNSIAYEVDKTSPPMWAKIGTNLNYAKAMEFGTGSQSDAPDSTSNTHFPPPAALNTWARRHGFSSGYVVARSIARKGGLKPRRYLRDGLAESESTIGTFLAEAAGDIEREWGK